MYFYILQMVAIYCSFAGCVSICVKCVFADLLPSTITTWMVRAGLVHETYMTSMQNRYSNRSNRVNKRSLTLNLPPAGQLCQLRHYVPDSV